jgi:outer membrane receptor protein involved in Fe transport
VQGLELSWQQQFTALPGALSGLGMVCSATVLSAHGDFGAGAVVRGNQVEGIYPKTGNLILNWRYRRFLVQGIANHIGEGLLTYSAVSPMLHEYDRSRTKIDGSIAYQLRPSLSVYINVDNITNAPQARYMGVRERVRRMLYGGSSISSGISGRF